MASILLKGILLDSQQSDILISGRHIDKIGPAASSAAWELAGDIEVMDCSGKIAIPGFVNMHTHSAMSLMRGIGEDMAFSEWIELIWKKEEKLTPDYVYWGTVISCIEMIRSGTTTFNDQYWLFDSSVQAAKDMGLRIATGFDLMDRCDPSITTREKEQCIVKSEPFLHSQDPGLIFQLAFHSIYSVSEELIIWARDFAEKHNLNLHIHLSETQKEVEDCKAAHGGLSPVEYLAELGVLSPRLLAAHTLWLSEHDIELLAANKVNCIHNINSNTKLSSGYRFLYNEMRDAGINICIGTDGCASSNNLDMLEAMKNSALFQKAWRNDPAAMPLAELMDMASINGAKALRFNSGQIAEGKLADINIVETDNTAFLSNGPFLANLIYSAHSDCIDSVICNGRFLMRHREIPREKELLASARKMLSKIL